MMASDQIGLFQKDVLIFYKNNARTMPWRIPEKTGYFDPYKILISEVMLQQTQVARVIPKYDAFIQSFPTVEALAAAPLAAVLAQWSGLGYNRRAKYLHQAARLLMSDFANKLPASVDLLTGLPGVGKNTAAAIVAYSFNVPVVFIETNIRTVYLHHFFKDETQITDSQLLPFITASLDTSNPRQWYWALMDYGTYLKQMFPNPSTASKHFNRQSRFEGSVRQVRGQVMKLLTEGPAALSMLQKSINDPRLGAVLQDLQSEELISQSSTTYHLGK